MTVVDNFVSLLSGNSWYPRWFGINSVLLTYSFLTAPDPAVVATNPDAAASFAPFDNDERQFARQALSQWSAAAGITFVEVSNARGELTFGRYELSLLGQGNAIGDASYPVAEALINDEGRLFVTGNRQTGGAVRIDGGFRSSFSPDAFLGVLLHEIGHALGLKHPFEGQNTLSTELDNTNTTVMSYTGPFIPQLGVLDGPAVRALYGAPGTSPPGSWDALSQTYTVEAAGDRMFVRGTSVRDVVAALGDNIAVATSDGDDLIKIGLGRAEVDAGAGSDRVEVTGEYLPNRGMALSGSSGFYRLSTADVMIHRYLNVETVAFSNGHYDKATEKFNFNLPTPAAPIVRRAWLDEAGRVVLGGAGTAGGEVTVRVNVSISASAEIAGNGTWTLTLPWIDPGWRPLTVLAWVQGQESSAVEFGTMQIGDDRANHAALGGSGRRFYFGRGGGDVFDGGPGDDLMVGGEGDDLAVIAAALAETRWGIAGDTMVLRGPQGTDTLIGVERIQFAGANPVTVTSLAGAADPVMAISIGGQPGYALPTPYVGPVGYLAWQMLGDELAEAAGGTQGNDFINLGAGDDAMNGLAGADVLDGGLGSNFITGGPDSDKFFLDGRSGGPTWSTITDWEPSEELALWGWQPSVSRTEWADQDGAPGWQGVTMRADLDGNGSIDATVTWSGRTRGELPAPYEFDGLLWFLPPPIS